MTSPRHYSPWERTEQEDQELQTALDSATPEQLSGFLDELIALAETATPPADTTPTER